MLKYKLCRICMKQKKANTEFVKIFESTEMGDLVANILIDFASITVDPSDGLPHIVCTHCFENLIRCREFQKLVVQNDSTLASLVEKTPDEIEKIIAGPLVRIEKVKKCKQSSIVKLMDTSTTPEECINTVKLDDPPASESSSSEDDDFTMEEEVIELPVEAFQPRLLCCCCPLQFGEEHEVIQHVKTEHAAIRNKLNIAPIDKDPEEVNQCELCFKYFVGMDKLVDHQAQYKNCKQCVECGGFYCHKWKLFCQCKSPVEAKPSKPKNPKNPYLEKVRCDLCGNLVVDLKSHKKKQHGTDLLKCKMCDFTTFQRNKMFRHVTQTHYEKRYPCPYEGCGKLFLSPDCTDFKRHAVRHTGLKKYICKYCSKPFSDCSDCKRHEWQHAGISPYMCSKCNKMFLRKNQLLAHENMCTKSNKKA